MKYNEIEHLCVSTVHCPPFDLTFTQFWHNSNNKDLFIFIHQMAPRDGQFVHHARNYVI